MLILDWQTMISGSAGMDLAYFLSAALPIDATEEQVRKAGFEPHNHADYEPGRRFYFLDRDGVEFEVISYT